VTSGPPEDSTKPDPQVASSKEVSGQSLVMFGGILTLASFLIFDVLTDDYALGTSTVAVALLAFMIARKDAGADTSLANVAILSKVLGYALAATGVVEILSDIESSMYDSFLTVIGALVAYAGFVLAFLGARSIET